jgi:N-acylneuraminate cytidylyltransferase
MKSLAIIPARGGSKRIPGKNIRPFLGKPIIAYSIEVALESKLFDTVMVSTDDAEIAQIARASGAEVPFMRSAKNADDHATTADVLLEVLEDYRKTGHSYDIACCIYPTAPLLRVGRLAEAYEILVREHRDCVFPVVRFSYPIQRSLRIVDGKVEMFHPEHLSTRSQDLEDAYHDAGQFYMFRVIPFLDHKVVWMPNTGAIVCSEMEVQDLDNLSDWTLAEMKYQYLQSMSGD